MRLRATFASAIRFAAHVRYLRGIVPRCCRGSYESLMQRPSGLPCLARKPIFSSRLIVAFIGSFALHLHAMLASAFRSAAHFRYDNRVKLSKDYFRNVVTHYSAFRIPNSALESFLRSTLLGAVRNSAFRIPN